MNFSFDFLVVYFSSVLFSPAFELTLPVYLSWLPSQNSWFWSLVLSVLGKAGIEWIGFAGISRRSTNLTSRQLFSIARVGLVVGRLFIRRRVLPFQFFDTLGRSCGFAVAASKSLAVEGAKSLARENYSERRILKETQQQACQGLEQIWWKTLDWIQFKFKRTCLSLGKQMTSGQRLLFVT